MLRWYNIFLLEFYPDHRKSLPYTALPVPADFPGYIPEESEGGGAGRADRWKIFCLPATAVQSLFAPERQRYLKEDFHVLLDFFDWKIRWS